jgi:hypothetical protein
MGLVVGTLRHEHLRSLVTKCGELDGEVVRGIAASDVPRLEHLELWLAGGGTRIDRPGLVPAPSPVSVDLEHRVVELDGLGLGSLVEIDVGDGAGGESSEGPLEQSRPQGGAHPIQ